MKYFDTDQEIRVGDIVEIENGLLGTVIYDFDNHEVLNGVFQVGKTDFLSCGVMIETKKYGWMHYQSEDEDIKFIRSISD